MKLATPPRILLVAGLCVASLITLVISEGFARSGGQEALLPIEAVDPRALLSGHYVQINLTQRLPPERSCPEAVDGDWVALRSDGVAHRVVGGASSREGALQLGPLPVKGSFFCSPPDPGSATPGSIVLDVGINRFYVGQAEAVRIETLLRERAADASTGAFAIVSVGRDGRARLRGLQIDEQRFELSWL